MIFNIYQCLHVIVFSDLPGAIAPFFKEVLQIPFVLCLLGMPLISGCKTWQWPKGIVKMPFFFVVQISYHRS